ncbi:hypothetical protein LTR78_002994 [Recurvomyces mirabilis]|uniref:asparagine synthase (glutamine-hydrolyzing) n=1 Tax=Recurvomyces mirabilis TaxID=574656 RepID=A0AAE0WT83_9PEZI|nr:hypothetical protein LTR78_002994 [Recurvomyces mirabilis]KAK5159275.1 hypothetical protein LTS14_002417 [Recurvomyces mirabilis]
MCGLAAIFGKADGDALEQMLDSIVHRGKDERGIYIASDASLGIQRLSIMGIEDGSQPMTRPSSGLSIAILDVYEKLGLEGLPLLDGIFAFVIFDEQRNEWAAARDCHGVKPLYYLQTEDTWYLASEIKALTTTRQDERLIREVPPGHYLTRKELQRYNLDFRGPMSAPQPALLRSLLQASVEKQLQADPGPTSQDSPSGPITLLTLLRPGWSQSISASVLECGLDVHDLQQEIMEAVRVTESYRVPTVLQGLLTMKLAKAAAEEGVKFILSGEGADELFAGYGFLREIDAVSLHKARRTLLANIGKTECKRLDRGTMAYSVEARVPFLDDHLVQWALALPADCLIHRTEHGLVERWILREAFKDLLPSFITQRTKLAFYHGSGIMPIANQASQSIDDAAFESYKREHPNAHIEDKISMLLHNHWRHEFGDAGGLAGYDMFCYYPLMQGFFNQSRLTTGGTGESEAEVKALDETLNQL